MRRLIYISAASTDVEADDLAAILQSAKVRNHELSVTGSLLYNGLNFLQVLEGDKSDVANVYMRIIADRRHSGVVTILDEEAEGRAFPDWSMQLSVVPSTSGSLPNGLKAAPDFMSAMPSDLPANVRTLLSSFNSMSAIRAR